MSNNSVFSLIDHEVFALTAHESAKKQSACIVTWVLPCSIQKDYPECMVLSSPYNYTHELILSTKRFVLHLLADTQAFHLLDLGVDSGREHDKLSRVAHKIKSSPSSESGMRGYQDIILEGVCGYRICELIDTFELNERVALIGRVVEETLYPDRHALRKRAAFASLTASDRQILYAKQQEVASKSQGR